MGLVSPSDARATHRPPVSTIPPPPTHRLRQPPIIHPTWAGSYTVPPPQPGQRYCTKLESWFKHGFPSLPNQIPKSSFLAGLDSLETRPRWKFQDGSPALFRRRHFLRTSLGVWLRPQQGSPLRCNPNPCNPMRSAALDGDNLFNDQIPTAP